MEYIKQAIDELIVEKDANLVKIARLLGHVDSTTLPVDTRKNLGLPAEATPSQAKDTQLPTLFTPGQGLFYEGLDPNSEAYLSRAFGYIGDSNKAPLYLLGCLLASKQGLLAGVCIENTEFPNGATFLRGIWYRPRTRNGEFDEVDPNSLFGKAKARTRNQADQVDNEELSLNLHPRYPLTVQTNDLIIWQDIGGCWEPARKFNPQERFAWISEG